jgi:diguanylate cyclase (GGDEF)-like protein
MRKGRFAGLGDKALGAVSPPRLAELFLFDFMPAADEDADRVAADRRRALELAFPLLAGGHLLWGTVLLGALAGAGAKLSMVPIAALLAAILLLDAALWAALRRLPWKPHRMLWLTALQGLVTGALWIAAAGSAAGDPQAGTLLVQSALIAGAASGVPVFNAVPLLLTLAGFQTLVLVAQIRSGQPILEIGAAIFVFLFCVCISRSRHLILSARERVAFQWQAKKAQRFVQDFEASGRGWFWETNADGVLSYASDPLANHLRLEAGELIGRRFDEVLMLGTADEQGDERRTLGFHLSVRFPFSDVVVRAPASDEIWWSLSGSPNFDDYGRFLGFRGLGTNLSEQRRTEAETTKLARYDTLTGLPNRAMMRATLDEALANADARRRGCALMMIDLDRFKHVNDTLGHPVGDQLLKKVAARLAKVLGDDGQVGRLGGDEFEAILPGVEEQSVLSDLARRMIEDVSRPYRIDGHEVRIGISVGIAVARPGKALAEGLIRDADLALYAAKADGRGTFRFFAQEMHALATERQILEADLRLALGKDQLRLVYQPIVDSVTEEVVAFEALLRWHHPFRGIVPPSTTIPLAEECGLMPRIGEWVLRTACAEAVKWPGHIRVAVNLSPLQFTDPALGATVTGTLASSRLDPERLELEINEEVFLADRGVTDQTLKRLRRIGVRLALDNFGTGHSGLGHLRDAPLDKIKIDQSFVRGAAGPAPPNAAIVRAIVVLAESLGMDTTAEGAETLEEVALIRRLGCSQVQGFIFGRPVPAEEALALANVSKPTADVVGFSRPPRHRLIRTGSLRFQGRTLDVRLRNISAGGAMAECDEKLLPGIPVELDLDDAGCLQAQVRWCQHGQVGLHFAVPFELASLGRARSSPGAPKPRKTSAAPAHETPAPAGRSPLAAKTRRAS